MSNPESRPTVDEYFMNLARVAATRATCLRKKVGAIIMEDKQTVTTGYNGSEPGEPHCIDAGVGCLMEDGHCVRTIHAEDNALRQAKKRGLNVVGASIYVTASPCFDCFQLIAEAGLKRIVFGELYRDGRIRDLAAERGIELVDMSATRVS